jgi:hypothetical protein
MLLLLSKCILEVVFCESVQHRLRFCLDHLNCVKMAAFQFYLLSGKQRTVKWVGNDSHVVFGYKFFDERESVRRCVIVMQQPVLLSPKFGAKSSHIFTQSPLNVTVVCGIDCLAYQGEPFVNNSLHVR